MASTVLVSNLGFPRIGVQRELKKAVEAYWSGKATVAQLQATAAELRARHWQLQQAAGVQLVPCGDFTLYDHMLDMVQVLGCVPNRYDVVRRAAPGDALTLYFAQARGYQTAAGGGGGSHGGDVTAMEMTKWFDTNYHYIVPELLPNQTFTLNSAPVLAAYKEAVAVLSAAAAAAPNATAVARPVLVGPLTFLLLSKLTGAATTPAALLALLPALVPVYVQLLTELAAAGATWVQIDEPILVTDLVSTEPAVAAAFQSVYATLRASVPESLKLMLATYFGGVAADCAAWVYALPVQCVHVDVTRASRAQLAAAAEAIGKRADGAVLSLGLVDGRNI